MLLLLPILAFGLLVRTWRLRVSDWREATLLAAVCWGMFLYLVTEGLSIGHNLTKTSIAAAWVIFCALLAAVLFRKPQARPAPSTAPEKLNRWEVALVLAIVAIIVPVAITGLVSPPNTWDAMEYHLPRLTEWIGNHSVAFYPTWDYAQLVLSPWAEYAMLHIDVLYGSDRLVNMLQLLAMIGSAIGVSLIVNSLGGNRTTQLIGALLCAAIPEGILEASGAMNTYALTFWLVTATYFLLRFREEPLPRNVFAASFALGLAVFTKGVAYAYVPPLVIACWLTHDAVRKRSFLKWFPLVVAITLAVNAPQYARNMRLSGSPLGVAFSSTGATRVKYANDKVSVKNTVSNLVRNAALHLGTPVGRVNQITESTIRKGLRAMGIDPDDPVTTWRGISFQVHALSRREVFAGNLLHCLLAFAALAWLAVRWKDLPNAGWLSVGLIGGLLLFSALLQWQVWSTRLHLPLFAIGSAVLALALVRAANPKVVAAVCLLFFLFALPFSLMNELRPLVARKFARTVWARSRAELYVADSHADMAGSLLQTAQFVRQSGCREIGLDLTLEPFEYPVMGLLNAGNGVQVRTLGVVNPTSHYANSERPPVCAVVCLGCAHVREKWTQYRNIGQHVALFNEAAVFTANGPLPNTDPPAAVVDDTHALAEDTAALYATLRVSELPTADDVFDQIRGSHPIQAFELSSSYQDLSRWKVVALVLWENSGDVIRKARQQQPLSADERDLLLTTNEAFHYWQKHYAERVHEAQEKAAQLDAAPHTSTP